MLSCSAVPRNISDDLLYKIKRTAENSNGRNGKASMTSEKIIMKQVYT